MSITITMQELYKNIGVSMDETFSWDDSYWHDTVIW